MFRYTFLPVDLAVLSTVWYFGHWWLALIVLVYAMWSAFTAGLYTIARIESGDCPPNFKVNR